MPFTMTAPHDALHERTDFRAAVWAGLIAGIVFMMIEMMMTSFIMGESPWGPPRMMAALLMGNGVLPSPGNPATFSMPVFMAAMGVHIPLSIIYGLVIGWLVHRFDAGFALVIGAVFGVAIYLVNFYMIAPAIAPWFGMARNAMSLMSHALFGVIAAETYIGLRRPREG